MVEVQTNQRGQTLLIIVFAMSLGLLVMISVASRVINSVARTTRTNYYQKATAAAEAGAEIFLLRTREENVYNSANLANFLVIHPCPVSGLSNLSSVNAACKSPFSQSQAFVGLENFPVGNESFYVKSGPGETIHVDLREIDTSANEVWVCWHGIGTQPATFSQHFMYRGAIAGGYQVEKDLYICDSGAGTWCVKGLASTGPQGDTIKTALDDGTGNSCYGVSVYSDSVALRIFTYPGGAQYKITAHNNASGSITPVSLGGQGYRIVSIGEVTSVGGGSLDAKKASRKKVIVEKTFPYPAGPWWDFAVTSVSGDVVTSESGDVTD